MVKGGSDISAEDIEGHTPLSSVIAKGWADIVRVLEGEGVRKRKLADET